VGDDIVLQNYVYIEWTDLPDGKTSRIHRTSMQFKLTQNRDVDVETNATLNFFEPRLTISRVVYVPGDVGAGARRFDLDYQMEIGCPMAPILRNVTFALATTDPNTFASTNSSILQNYVGNGQVFSSTQPGEYETPAIGWTNKVCVAGQETYIVTGTLHVRADTACYADAEYTFTFSHTNWFWNGQWPEILSYGPTFTLKATINDGFNFCAQDNLNASVVASLQTIGSGPWSVEDKVTFHGNITSVGLPVAQIYLRQAKVYNTKPEYNATRYPKLIFTSATAALSAFGTATEFKSKFISSYYNGSDVEVGTWSTAHLKEDTDRIIYPAGTPRPYLAQVNVVGGTTLSSVYIVPSDYGDANLGFSLELTWRCVAFFERLTRSKSIL
jgi:hypothetical protein